MLPIDEHDLDFARKNVSTSIQAFHSRHDRTHTHSQRLQLVSLPRWKHSLKYRYHSQHSCSYTVGCWQAECRERAGGTGRPGRCWFWRLSAGLARPPPQSHNQRSARESAKHRMWFFLWANRLSKLRADRTRQLPFQTTIKDITKRNEKMTIFEAKLGLVSFLLHLKI